MPSKPPSLISGLDPAALFGLGAEQTASATEWEPPSLEDAAKFFPQWQVRRLLGRGGMGAVYEMHQPELDRLVAVKLLPIEASRDEHLVERFRREARTLAKLRHPGIVALLESGVTSAGHLFFVMEHVDGSPLNQWISSGRLNVSRAIDIVRQVCEALAYAHAQGVIHRDIKPSNILLDSQGRAKVADFGLACWQQAADQPGMTLSRTGAFMGTPAYAAPEQVRNAAGVDHRADIYALGVLLYEMLTGDLPRGVFQPPSRKRAGTDARLDQVVQRALQERPEDRYQAASELRDDVSRSQAREPVKEVKSPSSVRRFFKVAAASLLLLGLAGIVSLSWWGAGRAFLTGNAEKTPPPSGPTSSSGEARAGRDGPGVKNRQPARAPSSRAEMPASAKGLPANPAAPAVASAPGAQRASGASAAPMVVAPLPASGAAAENVKVHVWSLSPVAPALFPPKSLTTFDWRDGVLTLHGGAALLADGSVVVWDEAAPGKEHRFALPQPVSNLTATLSEVVVRTKDGQVYLLPRDGKDQPRFLAANAKTLFPSARPGQVLFSRQDGTPWLLSFSEGADEPAQMARYPLDPALIALDGSIWGISTASQLLARQPGAGGFEVQSKSPLSDLAAMGASVIGLGADDGKVHRFNGAGNVPDGMTGMHKILAVDGMALAFSRDLKAVLWGPKVEDSPQRFRLPDGVVYARLGPTGLMAAW